MEKKEGFQKHETSESQMEAVAKYVTAPSTVIGDIGDLLYERHALEKSENRKNELLEAMAPLLARYGKYLPMKAVKDSSSVAISSVL